MEYKKNDEYPAKAKGSETTLGKPEPAAKGKERFFTFIGDPQDNHSGPEKIMMFGHEFPKGKSVGIPDTPENAMAIEKLSYNNHFKNG